MDGIPALNLWDLVIQVFHSSPIKTNKTKDVKEPRGNPSADVQPNMRNHIPTKHTNFDPTDIDHVPPKGTHSGPSAMFCVFEDNEAGIKMIIKGRCPTMRHVSRTHRGGLDWSFDRSNLDPEIQIKYVDTKHQLADILTKGNFTCDEWNNLFCLFNDCHPSSLCCAKKFSLTSCTKRMAKKDARTKRR